MRIYIEHLFIEHINDLIYTFFIDEHSTQNHALEVDGLRRNFSALK